MTIYSIIVVPNELSTEKAILKDRFSKSTFWFKTCYMLVGSHKTHKSAENSLVGRTAIRELIPQILVLVISLDNFT